jgi:hypothetical protein
VKSTMGRRKRDYNCGGRRKGRFGSPSGGQENCIDTCPLQPKFEPRQTFLRKGDMNLLMGRRQHHGPHDVVTTGDERYELPGSGHFGWKTRDRDVLDQRPEQVLVEPVRQLELFATPPRGEPGFAHQKEHCLAAPRRLMKRTFPALAGAIPRLGSVSRKTSSQPCSASQSRSATT